MLPRENMDREVVWLMTTYMEMVQEVCVARGSKVLPLAVKGRLSERLRMSRDRAAEQLVINLSDFCFKIICDNND